jgi:hypothetical protein
MIEVRKFSAPLLELVVSHDNKQTLVTVFGVLALDDIILDSIDGLVSRFGLAEGVRDWVHMNHLQFVSMAPLESTYIEIDKYRVRVLYGKAAGRPHYGETWLRTRLKDGRIPCSDIGNKNVWLCTKEHDRLLVAEAEYDRRHKK